LDIERISAARHERRVQALPACVWGARRFAGRAVDGDGAGGQKPEWGLSGAAHDVFPGAPDGADRMVMRRHR
jgi:hypothetical protein